MAKDNELDNKPGLMDVLKGLLPKKLESEKPKPFNEFDVTSDKFSPEESKRIVDMVIGDIEADLMVQKDWIEERKKDMQMYNGERPTIIEGTTKKNWMSDRNLGVTGAISDTYLATLSATTYNPESIHAIATETNDIDNKDNWEKFAKWMLGKNEVNFLPTTDDFIFNKVNQGLAFFKITWDVKFEWIDRRIPKAIGGGFSIKTERKRFESAKIENIDNLDDILMPRYGSRIQELQHIIHIIHLTGDKIEQYGKEGAFNNIDDKYIEKIKSIALASKKQGLKEEKAKILSINDITDDDLRALPVDIYEWYGWFEKNGKYERYRFHVERETRTLMAGKPLRKIRRDGKYPFSGGPFIKIPGEIKGKSLPWLIKDPTNALNSVFNQKQDFQFVSNCPFGFHRVGEGYTKAKFDLEPGVSYPLDGNPNEQVYFPNIQRSMAWADSDVRLLFEVIEKQTGAASYFMSTERNSSGTATRDMLVKEKSETRFGKWVNSIQDEQCEAITMAMILYQDWAPKELAERILGQDGKKLFRNLSPETLRGGYDTRMEPDIVAGSKAYERQIALWGFANLQGTIWLDPRVNPKGNWNLVADTMKRMGFGNPERYLPPEPPAEMGTGKEVKDVWARLMQGEIVEPEDNWNPMEMLAGLIAKREKDYFNLSPEYRPNLDKLIFQVSILLRIFIKKAMEEKIASEMAGNVIQRVPQAPQGGGAPPVVGNQPPNAGPTNSIEALPQGVPSGGLMPGGM